MFFLGKAMDHHCWHCYASAEPWACIEILPKVQYDQMTTQEKEDLCLYADSPHPKALAETPP